MFTSAARLLCFTATAWFTWPLLLCLITVRQTCRAVDARLHRRFYFETGRMWARPVDFFPWLSGEKCRLAPVCLVGMVLLRATDGLVARCLGLASFGVLGARPSAASASSQGCPGGQKCRRSTSCARAGPGSPPSKPPLRVMVRDLATGMEAPVTELSPRYPELAAKGQVVVSGIPPTDLRVALLRRDYLRAVQPHSHYKRVKVQLPRAVHLWEPCASCDICGTGGRGRG